MTSPADRVVRLLARSEEFAADDPVQERTRRAALFRLAQGGSGEWWVPGMDVARVLLSLYGRVSLVAKHAVEGLDSAQLAERPAPGADTIGWLIWQVARTQDQQFAELLGAEELLPGSPPAGGPDALLADLAAVHDRGCSYLAGLRSCDLDRLVDGREPPLALGVRLVRTVDDCLRYADAAVRVRKLLTT